MVTQQHVSDALNNAVRDNGYTELLEWPDSDIAIDLLAFDGLPDDVTATVEELIPLIAVWRSEHAKHLPT